MQLQVSASIIGTQNCASFYSGHLMADKRGYNRILGLRILGKPKEFSGWNMKHPSR